jgi:putative transposase
MNCPHCTEVTTKKRAKKTKLGYTTFFCPQCKQTFNERSGTPFNYLEFPTDIVLLAIVWRLRYKLSLRDVAEMFLERGFTFTHEAVRDWEARFAPLITDQLRIKRRGQAGTSWYVDETSIKVQGKWCYLYRAIDHEGNLVDSMLSRKTEHGGSSEVFQAGSCIRWLCS